MYRYLQKGGKAGKMYVASPADSSLLSLLHESFKIMELRFANYDHDGVGTLMFRELQRELSLVGFTDMEKLEEAFRKIDFDGNGTLDFSEFICLLYFWVNVGDYSQFFRHPDNAKIVHQAFNLMETSMIRYDADHNRRLSKKELDDFFSEQLPKAVPYYNNIYVSSGLKDQGEIKFPAFMYLIYETLCEMPESSISGKYRGISFKPSKAIQGSSAVGENSEFWKELKVAFSVLEADFVRFDQDKNGFVDYAEITQAIPATRPRYDRLDTLSRLEHAFHQVDLNQDQTLDYFEFCYLCFMMTQNGSYLDLVDQTEGATHVKKAFINIHTCYRSFDADRNNRLTYDEMENFCNAQFGIVPANLQKIFGEIAQKSSSANGQEALDLVRFMKLLYVLVCPTAKFAPHQYSPGKRKASQQVVSILKPPKSDRPPRFKVVVPSKFVKEKLLGQGGQGTVYKGKYEGFPVAAKTMLGNPDAQLIADTLREVDFFLRLDHPNCHLLLGAKTTLENGGIMLLTEICENGSLFDCYSTKRMRFDVCTAWRICMECAQGFKVIHDLGFMHRDIKSL
eukprot:768537-Hanusia_phi.AAC.15